ncbi:MAG: hypothetical protein LKF52_01700 [Butyrivibrio sp.]|jgi:capsular polysaccharide biosynthesis protein|nr:hypothetical protein [Butyrivibrio sp.]
MNREENEHRSEILNLRSFYLRLIRRIWLIPAALLAGAVIGGAIYFLATVTFGPERSYSAQSKLYLNFAYDESGKVYDYYNGYTWNLLMSTDDILNQTMKNLAAQGIPELQGTDVGSGSLSGVTRAEVIASTDAEIPSDSRVMVLTITSHDQKLAQAILKATDDSLVSFGTSHSEFEGIDVRSTSDAALVTYTDRTTAAVITGAVLAGISMIMVLLLLDCLDDAVYVPEDCERRYHLPVLGMLAAEGRQLPERFRNELIAAFEHTISGQHKVALISVSGGKNEGAADKACQILHEMIRSDFDFQKTDVEALQTPGTSLESYRRLQETDGVILLLKAGEHAGTMAEHMISQLHKHDCPILGIILTETDPGFMKRYYRC